MEFNLNDMKKLCHLFSNDFELGEKIRELVDQNNNFKIDNNMNMMSLYDYLGRAAGPELGQRVATAAAAQKVKFQTKLVDHKGYTGDVMMYPKEFLDKFFGGGLSEGGESGKQLLKG